MKINKENGMKNKYGMKFRPFGIACQPDGAINVEQVNKANTGFYDVVVYDRELSDQEVQDFELVKIN